MFRACPCFHKMISGMLKFSFMSKHLTGWTTVKGSRHHLYNRISSLDHVELLFSMSGIHLSNQSKSNEFFLGWLSPLKTALLPSNNDVSREWAWLGAQCAVLDAWTREQWDTSSNFQSHMGHTIPSLSTWYRLLVFVSLFPNRGVKNWHPSRVTKGCQVQWPTTARRLAHLQQRDLKEWNREIQVLSQGKEPVQWVRGVRGGVRLFLWPTDNVWTLKKTMLEATCEECFFFLVMSSNAQCLFLRPRFHETRFDLLNQGEKPL